MAADLVRIWYVSSQRLCNFHCEYCVSTEDYAKSNSINWLKDNDQADFEKAVRWIGTRPFPVGVRLATLGEPFTSWDFLKQTAWLTTRPTVRYAELLTNGSLLKNRLPKLADIADVSKLSLWITHHHTEISIERVIENAALAHSLGCFVVVNALLFPDNLDQVSALRDAAVAAGLRFNVDLGYDPSGTEGTYGHADQVVPFTQEQGWSERAVALGANPELLATNLIALDQVHGKPCSAGHDNIYIGIDGEVYPCSRYYELGQGRLGNVFDDGFELELRDLAWAPCRAPFGCSNKEDFLNLELIRSSRTVGTPSLGWLGT